VPVEAPAVPVYSSVMSIELPGSVEEQLRNLAAKQGRDARTLVEEAVRQYLESAAITDLDATKVAEAQAALLANYRMCPTGRPTTREAWGDLVG